MVILYRDYSDHINYFTMMICEDNETGPANRNYAR